MKFIFGLVLLFVCFLALVIKDLDKVLTSIPTGAGAIGLGVGLAMQVTLSYSVSGVILTLIPSLRIGDYVDTIGLSGFVSETNLKGIVLRIPDNYYIIISNSKSIVNPFATYSLTDRLHVDATYDVGHESDAREVEDLVLEIIVNAFP